MAENKANAGVEWREFPLKLYHHSLDVCTVYAHCKGITAYGDPGRGTSLLDR